MKLINVCNGVSYPEVFLLLGVGTVPLRTELRCVARLDVVPFIYCLCFLLCLSFLSQWKKLLAEISSFYEG